MNRRFFRCSTSVRILTLPPQAVPELPAALPAKVSRERPVVSAMPEGASSMPVVLAGGRMDGEGLPEPPASLPEGACRHWVPLAVAGGRLPIASEPLAAKPDASVAVPVVPARERVASAGKF